MSKLKSFIARTVTIVCLMFTSGYAQTAAEQDNRPEILDSFLTKMAERGQFNGNILIAEKGEIIYQKAIGLRSTLPGDSLNLGTQFRLASACAPFTAMAVMRLQEKGLIEYEDLVEKYVPEWPYKGATIRNLLNEISGFPGTNRLFDLLWKPDLSTDDPERIVGGNEDMLEMATKHLPEAWGKPGEMYRHSSTDYILLATIVQRISGTPFHQYLREEVFLPAGMNDSYAFSPLREDPLTNRAIGLMQAVDGSGIISRDFDYLQALDGFGLYSTLGDLFRWDRALYTDQLLPQSSLAAAFRPGVLNNGKETKTGFGWGLYGGQISADGYRAGFGVWINRDTVKQNCIIILTNCDSYLWGGTIQGVRKILKGEDYELPKLNGTTLVGHTLIQEGEEAARARYAEIKNLPEEYDLGGVMGLQALGHFLSLAGYQSEAFFAFRLNIDEYPDVAFVWNNLGDEYKAIGDTVNAVASYQEALAIDSSSRRALEALQLLK